GQYMISQGLRALPYEWKTDSLKGYSLNQMSIHLFPFGLSFLLPTFVSILVQEKEDRHRMMMAMNGLKTGPYYLGHYVEFMVMQLILSLFFCLTNVAIKSHFILRTNPLIVIVLLIIWAHVQISMSFVFASLFSNTRRATLMVYFFVAISCIMSSVTEQIFQDGLPFAWFIHPTFNFFNMINTGILHAGRVNGLYPMVWSDFSSGTTLFKCILLLVGESFLFLILTFYFDAVAPSEYGVQKPWHFPVTFLFKKRRVTRDPEDNLASHARGSTSGHNNEPLEGADADVYAERDRVQTQYEPSKTPLIIDNLFHRYRGKVEPALRGMTFGVETNTVLGLLGPNGAGKSTMIHLLTGLYSPTSGTAYVAGADIRTEMATVHSKIGVCPQHDILWGDLTVADHLLFYSRLRGIPPRLEQQAVTYAIASVSLTKFRDRQVKGLSGGEKRRVSIAISLLGDNSVIFLDEPSTGLDPAVRRVIWDIINRVKVNRTVVLTTHSMEEADILSDRIAIMTTGRLRCIGTSLHLKELYGSGFRLNISSKPGQLEEACQSVISQLLQGTRYRRIDKFTNASTFEFDLQQQQIDPKTGKGQLSRIFSTLSQPGAFPDIEDWGVSQTTLEDVFIKIVTEGD
ncbi:P-loop containing nucleoside triphosphate hydrolase protein, partial [Mortierella sp. GBAus27b]